MRKQPDLVILLIFFFPCNTTFLSFLYENYPIVVHTCPGLTPPTLCSGSQVALFKVVYLAGNLIYRSTWVLNTHNLIGSSLLTKTSKIILIFTASRLLIKLSKSISWQKIYVVVVWNVMGFPTTQNSFIVWLWHMSTHSLGLTKSLHVSHVECSIPPVYLQFQDSLITPYQYFSYLPVLVGSFVKLFLTITPFFG